MTPTGRGTAPQRTHQRRIFRILFWVLVVFLMLIALRAAQVTAWTGWSPNPATVVFITATAFVLGLWLNHLGSEPASEATS